MTQDTTRPPLKDRILSALQRAWEYEKHLPKHIRDEWNLLVLEHREGRALMQIMRKEAQAARDGDTSAWYRLSARNEILQQARGNNRVHAYREALKVGTKWWMQPPTDPTIPPANE